MRQALRVARLGKGLSQRQLAELVGIDQSYMYRIEDKNYLPSVPVMKAITRELGGELVDYFDELRGGATA